MNDHVVVTGWGQVTQAKDALPPWLDPLDMMEQAARRAGEQAGPGALAAIDCILIVRPQSRDLIAPAAELARRLGASPRHTMVSGIGGQVPQQFVNQAAGMLARGEAETILICGAETFYPRAADAVRGEQALLQGIPTDYASDDAVGSSALEQAHGLSLPIHGFPLFETALWAESGMNREAWLARVGALWSDFSAVAERHPNAWTRRALSAAEITTPTADNRPICFPYTKRMVSLVMADIGAAVILTTAKRAAHRAGGAGVPVYFRGGGYAKDRQRFLADKDVYTRSAAMAQATERAQSRAGIRTADIECFDLYSCFPCAVAVARRELGIVDGDTRPLTMTGGLGFFGGPGSNYALHGIATMAEAIAGGRYHSGMTTALGWFMHKYAAGIYAATPQAADLGAFDREDDARPEAGAPPVALDPAPAGRGHVETHTVIYARDQTPQRALIYGRTTTGARFVANAPHAADVFARLTTEHQVGQAVTLHHDAASGVTEARFLN